LYSTKSQHILIDKFFLSYLGLCWEGTSKLLPCSMYPNNCIWYYFNIKYFSSLREDTIWRNQLPCLS